MTTGSLAVIFKHNKKAGAPLAFLLEQSHPELRTQDIPLRFSGQPEEASGTGVL